jgi:hypothetical protein
MNSPAVPTPARCIALLVALAGCDGVVGDRPGVAKPTAPAERPADVGEAHPGEVLPPFAPAGAVMASLTGTQYRNAVSDLLGAGLPEVALEPDTNPYLFTSIGAARSTAAERTVRAWEAASHRVTEATFAVPERRAALLGCAPGDADAPCVRTYFERFLRRAWRRPASAAELDRFVGLTRRLGASSVWTGLRYATAAALQSPSFLYRVELGVPAPGAPARRRYTGYEMASRLAFTLWNSVPDDALLDAAARGALDRDDTLRTEARRLLRNPRARSAARAFFVQYLGLGALDGLARDPTLFPDVTPALAASMREEVERLVEDVVFTHDGDFRAVFSRASTFLDARLAALYGIPMPSGAEGFVRVALPAESGRGSLLTTAALLAVTAHPNATSPTARGRYVRERLLCERVPDPPMNVPLNLDAGDSGLTPTLRDRLERHRRDPACAGCHSRTDPVGLGFEDFDAIGRRRVMEAGRPVDARGDLDGVGFVGARALGEILARDPRVAACVVRQVYRFANARLETPAEASALADLEARFAARDYRFLELLVELVASDGFRTVAEEGS